MGRTENVKDTLSDLWKKAVAQKGEQSGFVLYVAGSNAVVRYIPATRPCVLNHCFGFRPENSFDFPPTLLLIQTKR